MTLQNHDTVAPSILLTHCYIIPEILLLRVGFSIVCGQHLSCDAWYSETTRVSWFRQGFFFFTAAALIVVFPPSSEC